MTYCLINTSRSFYFWNASLITCGVLKWNLLFSPKRTFFAKTDCLICIKKLSLMKYSVYWDSTCFLSARLEDLKIGTFTLFLNDSFLSEANNLTLWVYIPYKTQLLYLKKKKSYFHKKIQTFIQVWCLKYN